MAVAPQNIMATLRGMPDAQLAKYAAMHKNDPFIFPLAFQESQTRKQVRNAQQAQGGMNQPKVVDQDLAQMMPQVAPQASQLPEDIGIAQLPAQNMQGMATGGIVAFEEGGEVPRYGGFTDGSLIKEKDVKSAYDRWMASQPSWFQQATPTSGQREADAKAEYERLLNAYQTRPDMSQPGSTLPSMNTAAADKVIPEVTTSSKDTSKERDTKKERTEKVEPAPRKEGAGSVAMPAAPVGGIDALATAYKPSSAEDLGKSAKAVALEANKESEAAYKPYAEMLQKERADLDARSSDNKSMALLQAGLGILGGTSHNAFENISKGGMQGLASYQEAKRLDDASKKALMASEIAMMQAQRAERSGNHKDAVALIGQAEQSNQFGVNAGLKAQELKQTGEYQRGMVGVQQGRNEILGASNRQSEKQMAEYTKIQNAVTKSLANDANYLALKTPAEKAKYETEALRNAMARNPFLSALSANIGFVQAPTAGQVRGDYTTDQ